MTNNTGSQPTLGVFVMALIFSGALISGCAVTDKQTARNDIQRVVQRSNVTSVKAENLGIAVSANDQNLVAFVQDVPSALLRKTLLRDADLALEAIKEAEDQNAKEISIQRVNQSIANLTVLLTSDILTDDGIVVVRNWRGRGYMELARARYYQNGEKNIDEIEAGINDFDFVMASPLQNQFPNAGYYAGQLAYNYLDNEVLAGEYWLPCADRGHGGCINIVASGYFTGQYGLAVDYQQSANYHQQVFDLGTSYGCAGSFSGLSLANLKAYFPGLETQSTWQDYLSATLDMQKKAAKIFEVPSACSKNALLIEAFLLHLKAGENKTNFLKDIIEDQDAEPWQIALAQYFRGDLTRAGVDAVPADPSLSYEVCSRALLLVRHAMIAPDLEVVGTDIQAIKTANRRDCASDNAWLRALKITTEGA